jgi:hypothetical protein
MGAAVPQDARRQAFVRCCVGHQPRSPGPAGQHLLAEDVGVAAVVGQLPQHLHVQRPHHPFTTTGDDVVEGQGRGSLARPGTAPTVRLLHESIVSSRLSTNERSGDGGIPIFCVERPVSAWSNQIPST